MGMNGAIGRAKTLRAIRRDRLARAKAAGIDTNDRAAVARFNDAWSRVTLAGIGEQARCRCGGNRHNIITGWRA